MSITLRERNLALSMALVHDNLRASPDELRRAVNDLGDEVRALRQRHAEAVKLLADVEWAGTDSVYLTRFCVWCDENEKHGHADNCRYVALMAKARLT